MQQSTIPDIGAADQRQPKHVISLREFSREELTAVIREAAVIKRNPAAYRDALDRRGLFMLFQKTSTRTNLSFQSGMKRMGGYTVVMDWERSNFALSPIRYEVRYASRNCDLIMARLKRHEDIAELARYATVPVINGCCDKYHPCQALADLMTVYETSGKLEGTTIAFIGVRNNVANSLAAGCMALGVRLLLVTPVINEPSRDDELMAEALRSGYVEFRTDARAAAAEADYVYTDTWVDMEFYHEPSYAEERDRRLAALKPYQVNRALLQGRMPYIMHDMPIHPGLEIEEELVEADHSVIYRQAENRMYAQMALMLHLLAEQREAGA